MFKRLRWLIGLNNKGGSTKRLINAEQPSSSGAIHLPLFDAFHEVAVYIHRFHNLDLFQQGWYKIKVTMRWEDEENTFPGIPARVVQYEAPEIGYGNFCGVWSIDDSDSSFSTPAFCIKYARQDVFLSILVSFNLAFGRHEGQSNSAVILKFELMHAPVSGTGPDTQGSLDAFPAAVHEFRIPPKALLGLHSYCPIQFDAFHAVLIDTSIHIGLLKAGAQTSQLKVPSDSGALDGTDGENYHGSKKVHSSPALGKVEPEDSKLVMLFKALTASRNMMLEDLKRISEGIKETIDLIEVSSKHDESELPPSASPTNLENLETTNDVEKAGGFANFQREGPVQPFGDDFPNSFQSLGNQVSCLWNIFLKFHRAKHTKVLEFLFNLWGNDRRAEWSIWMIYSKVEIPQQYMSDWVEGTSSHLGILGRAISSNKLTEDPSQIASMRAELHRRSIAQMRINNRSLQDMYIFGDPLRVPIIIIEHVTNMPSRPSSVNSYFSPFEQMDKPVLGAGNRVKNKQSGSGHVLKVVVFVHGFQGHHLDLRLVRNQWLLLDPKIQFLMSETNEDKTTGDIREMGLRLAQEVVSFLKKKMDKASRVGNLKSIKLSFVGHSIGNIMIRTALTESIMEPYLRFLHTYVSISGPHLGYLYSSNSIFNSGMWLLKKLRGIQCFNQLTLTDDPDIQRTFLYQLCEQRTLENFRNVILISSPQDGYVPYHSARMELCPAAYWDYSKRGKAFLEMLNNCLDQIQSPSEHRVVMRCDINFDTSSYGRNLNTLVGRAAHIEFLESDIFARFIMWSFPELFR